MFRNLMEKNEMLSSLISISLLLRLYISRHIYTYILVGLYTQLLERYNYFQENANVGSAPFAVRTHLKLYLQSSQT